MPSEEGNCDRRVFFTLGTINLVSAIVDYCYGTVVGSQAVTGGVGFLLCVKKRVTWACLLLCLIGGGKGRDSYSQRRTTRIVKKMELVQFICQGLWLCAFGNCGMLLVSGRFQFQKHTHRRERECLLMQRERERRGEGFVLEKDSMLRENR